ncbi:MAG TPA: carbonic anhydrase family protein [Puia sp.]|nr:carbonic anhydrase family protein [Puia sp.]
MKNSCLFIFMAGIIFLSFACNSTATNTPVTAANDSSISVNKNDVINEGFLNKEAQSKLTPDSVLQILKLGNLDYTGDNLVIRNTSERIRKASLGQYPAAVILSCLDSRVPVEDVFHCGIGDLFVARVAGNISNEDILGSLEYGCKVSGAKLIVVLGHEYCGAVKSAIDNVKLGNITILLDKIRPAVMKTDSFPGEKSSKNPAFVEAVCRQNILNTIKTIRTKSPILMEMENKGEIKIVGAEYHMETGRVDFF